MKKSAQSQTQFASTNKRRDVQIKLEFIRFEKKDKANNKELFWLRTENQSSKEGLRPLTLEDLKRIVIEAENLIKIADGADLDELK